MASLADLFRRARESADYRRSVVLAENDYKLIADLVKVRKAKGLKQRDVAQLLGMSQQAISKIESYDSDPKLSTLRMYSTAIGAIVSHVVRPDGGQLDISRDWTRPARTVRLPPSPVTAPPVNFITARPSTEPYRVMRNLNSDGFASGYGTWEVVPSLKSSGRANYGA